jgi:hypothetical protein
MPLDLEAHALEQLGRARGVSGAVAGRIVRGHRDQLGEQAHLRRVLAFAEAGDGVLDVPVVDHFAKLPPSAVPRQREWTGQWIRSDA